MRRSASALSVAFCLLLSASAVTADTAPHCTDGIRDAGTLGGLTASVSRVPCWWNVEDVIPIDTVTDGWLEVDVTNQTEVTAMGGGCTAVVSIGDSTDDYTNFNCMVQAAPLQTVLFIDTGTLIVDTRISATKSEFAIRGNGAVNTTIDCSGHNGDCLDFGSVTANDWTDSRAWTAGFTEGTTELTTNLTSPSVLAIGGWLELDTTTRPTNGAHNPRYLVKILCIDEASPCDDDEHLSAGQLELDRPLRIDFSAGTKTINTVIMSEYVGFEDFTIDYDGACASAQQYTWYIQLSHAAYSWITGVTFGAGRYSHLVQTKHLVRSLIRGNSFEATCKTGSRTNIAALQLDNWSTDNVIVNNDVDGVPQSFESQDGSLGNVFAYNYMPWTGQADPGCSMALSLHGAASDTLFEGNDSICSIWVDTADSANYYSNVWFRNRIRARPTQDCYNGSSAGPNPAQDGLWDNSSGDQCREAYGVLLAHRNANDPIAYDFTVLGNFSPYIAGGPTLGQPIDRGTTDTWVEANVFRRELRVDDNNNTFSPTVSGNSPDDTDSTIDQVSAGDNDATTATNIINNVQGEVAAGGYVATWGLPASLLYDSAPSWWCQESGTWGSHIGADIDDYGGTYAKLPAQIRYESGTCTALSVSGLFGQRYNVPFNPPN